MMDQDRAIREDQCMIDYRVDQCTMDRRVDQCMIG